MINTTNLISQKIQQINSTAFMSSENVASQSGAVQNRSGLISAYLNNLAIMNTPVVKKSEAVTPIVYHNNLRSMFQNNEAKILAIVMRTFNAKDTNGNDYIDGNEQNGTFLNAIERLDEVKAQGFNTLHVLPIHPPGKMKAMGTAGSIYAPKDMLAIDPNLVDKNDPRSDKEQFKAFIDECHKRGIKVMLDMPSCASYDMFLEHPEWMAKERDGLAKTPQGWNDIRMFQPWEDEGKRTLNPKLLELHKQYVDMCIDLGIDGIRSDVARAKPVEFWDVIIPYSHMRDPEFAWLAETYTYEDASPQANMAYDRPEDSLRAGYDLMYGQYHIFHEWTNATTFMNYVKEMLDMVKKIMDKDDIEELRSVFPFISSFEQPDIDLMADATRIGRFSKGTILRDRKESIDGIVYIKEGLLRVYTNDGEKQMLLYYVPDGHVCVMTAPKICQSQAIEYHVETASDALLYIIPDEVITRLEKKYPELRNFIDSRLAMRLDRLFDELDGMLRESQSEQIENYLDYMSRILRKDTFMIKHTDIARDLGIRRESVSRILDRMQSEGKVEISRGCIRLLRNQAVNQA